MKGGKAVFAIDNEFRSFDPVTFRGATIGNDGPRAAAVFDVLMYELPTGKVEMQLAESITPSADASVWTLKLRSGVKFSDGTPFDAEAVKFNWERIKDPANKSPVISTASEISEMTVIDPLTLRITLKAPAGQFPRFVALYMTHIGSPTAIKANPAAFAEKPIGAGPFVLQEWVRDNRMTFRRNPNYWNAPLPYLDELVVRTIPDFNQAFNSVASGEVDAARNTTPADDKRARDAGLQVMKITLNGGSDIIFNATRPPFNDERLRLAFAKAINVDQLMATAYEGAGEQATTLFTKESPFYENIPLWKHDPAGAQALFDKISADIGGPIKFKIASSPVPRSVRATEVMQAQLESFKNVDVEITATDVQTLLADAFAKNYDAIFLADSWADPEPQLYSRFLSTASTSLTKFSDPAMDAALKVGHTSLNETERKAAYRTVQQIWAEKVPTFFFARLSQGWVADPKLQGVKLFFDGNALLDGAWMSNK